MAGDFIELLKRKSGWVVVWVREPAGLKSYRLKAETARQDLEPILAQGGVLAPDPFRKGAPLGGFRCE